MNTSKRVENEEFAAAQPRSWRMSSICVAGAKASRSRPHGATAGKPQDRVMLLGRLCLGASDDGCQFVPGSADFCGHIARCGLGSTRQPHDG